MAKTAVVLTFPWTEGDVTHRQGSTVKVDSARAKTLVRNGRANWPTEPSPRTERRRRAKKRTETQPGDAELDPSDDAPPADEVAGEQAHNTTAQDPTS